MHSTKNPYFGIVSCEKWSRKDVISQIGKMGFQKGWSHAVRNLGQLCELPCSFDVIAKHRIWGLRVGYAWCSHLPLSPYRLTPPPRSLLQKLAGLASKKVYETELTFSHCFPKLFLFGACW